MPRMEFTRQTRKKIENVGYMETLKKDNGTELYIYGDIVSAESDRWSAEDVCPQSISDFLQSIEKDEDITLYVNSGGGDVFAGIGIYNILQRHTGKITGIVEGLAASIASVILMACDTIEIAKGAQIMIHKPLTFGYGNADDFTKIVDKLDKCQQMITDIYMTKVLPDVTREQIEAAINAETWFNTEEAAQLFDIQQDDNMEALAACTTDYMLARYRNIPKDLKVQNAGTEEAKRAAEKEKNKILEDLFLYGTR